MKEEDKETETNDDVKGEKQEKKGRMWVLRKTGENESADVRTKGEWRMEERRTPCMRHSVPSLPISILSVI